ncbi:hemin uptake protein HemP [Escherichia coli]|nr:hemin uptake protein HemP [Escherichia coli]
MTDMQKTATPETDANHKTAYPAAYSDRDFTSQTLLGRDGQVLIIDHDGQEYLLRKTQAGKLLLVTK